MFFLSFRERYSEKVAKNNNSIYNLKKRVACSVARYPTATFNQEALTALNELGDPDARFPQDTSEGVMYDADVGFIEDRQSVSLFFGVLPIQKPVTRIGEATNPSCESSLCNFLS